MVRLTDPTSARPTPAFAPMGIPLQSPSLSIPHITPTVRPLRKTLATRSTTPAHRFLLSALASFLGFCAIPTRCLAAAPTLDHLYPPAVQAGSSASVQAVGKFDPWPSSVWCEDPSIQVQARKEAGSITITVPADAPPGPRFLRVFNADGASLPRAILITTDPQIAEVEPNDEFARPMPVPSLPAQLYGRLEKAGDVDSFAVSLAAGQSLVARVEAFVLGSPLDTVLRIVDPNGLQMAWNHDDGRSLDSALAWTAPSNSVYRVQVIGFPFPATSDVRFAGGPAAIYRLHLHRGPFVTQTWPRGVGLDQLRSGAPPPLELIGWNFSPALPKSWTPSALPPLQHPTTLSIRIPGAENILALPIIEGSEEVESEPNDSPTNAPSWKIPGAINGVIQTPGDVDHFAFESRPGERWLFTVESHIHGHPLDSWLALLKADGSELARNDDNDDADPRIDWTTPAADGGAPKRFTLVIGSTLHRGDSQHRYRIRAERALPEWRAIAAADQLQIAPGQTNQFKVNIARKHGHRGALTLTPVGLAPGLSAKPVSVPETGSEAQIEIVASPQAAPAQAPFRIEVATVPASTNSAATSPLWAHFELVSSTVNNGVPNGHHRLLAERASWFWTTLLAPKTTNAPAKKTP